MVEVAEPVMVSFPLDRMSPPVIVRPEAEANPPPPVTEMPPANVDVAVSLEVRAVPRVRAPCKSVVPLTVRLLENNPDPTTDKLVSGVLVAIPTLWVAFITIKEGVDVPLSPTTRAGRSSFAESICSMENRP